MSQCWAPSLKERPSFSELTQVLGDIPLDSKMWGLNLLLLLPGVMEPRLSCSWQTGTLISGQCVRVYASVCVFVWTPGASICLNPGIKGPFNLNGLFMLFICSSVSFLPWELLLYFWSLRWSSRGTIFERDLSPLLAQDNPTLIGAQHVMWLLKMLDSAAFYAQLTDLKLLCIQLRVRMCLCPCVCFFSFAMWIGVQVKQSKVCHKGRWPVTALSSRINEYF